MKIVKISQSNERAKWKDFRRGKITGTSIGSLYAKSRSKDGGFTDKPLDTLWAKVGERLSIAGEDEAPIVRGIRLEDTAVEKACEMLGLDNYVSDALTWQSDENENWLCSPDAYEDVAEPTWAMEIKCLDTKNHLRMIFNGCVDEAYQYQVANYFLVNEKLDRLYFVLYDDRLAIPGLVMKVFVITRDDVVDTIELLRRTRDKAEIQIDNIVKQLLDMAKEMKVVKEAEIVSPPAEVKTKALKVANAN